MSALHCQGFLRYHSHCLTAASDSASSVGEEISAAVQKLTGEAKINGDVYVNAVKKAASKVTCSDPPSSIHQYIVWLHSLSIRC